MRELLTPLVALSLLSSAGSALAAEIPARESRIVRVIVYPDRAEVTRRVSLSIPGGASTVLFTEIPAAIDPDSLRVSGSGADSSIGTVEIQERVERAAESADWTAANQGVKRLQHELSGLDAGGAVNAGLRSYLDSLRAVQSQKGAESIGEMKIDAAQLSAMLRFLRGGYEELAAAELDRAVKREQLLEAQQLAIAKRNSLRPPGDIRSKVAAVELQSERGGAIKLELTYVVGGASWRPVYRTDLDRAKSIVLWTAEGAVTQNTGEDWSGVELSLSTSQPSRGVEPPVLSTWLLSPYLPPQVVSTLDERKLKSLEKDEASVLSGELTRNERARDQAARGGYAAAAPSAPIENRVATLQGGLYQQMFAVAGRSDVAADGAEHRVVLRRDTLAAEMGYRATPSQREEAFSVATLHAPEEYPLLAGPVRVNADGAYIGGYRLDETAPGAELRLPFGSDSRIKIARVALPSASGSAGLTGRDRQNSFAFRTTIENLHDHAVTISIEEQRPVSQDERISVRLEDKTTPGWKEDRDRAGVLSWELKLAPKEKREILLAYSVRSPRELQISGL